MKSEDQLAQNGLHLRCFGFVSFVFILHIDFLAKSGTNQLKWGHSIITFALSG